MDYTAFLNRIESLCAIKGVSPSKAFVESGVGKDFASDIRRKNSKPSAEKVILLAQYFGVSLDWLLLGVNKDKGSLPELTDRERGMLNLFKGLGQDKQNAFLQILREKK